MISNIWLGRLDVRGDYIPLPPFYQKSFSVVVLVLLLLNCNSLPTPRLRFSLEFESGPRNV